MNREYIAGWPENLAFRTPIFGRYPDGRVFIYARYETGDWGATEPEFKDTFPPEYSPFTAEELAMWTANADASSRSYQMLRDLAINAFNSR